jgi:hypothetical protein
MFVEDGHLTTHRYWGEAQGRLQSRGDRSGAFDRPWAPQTLVGRVVVRRRAGRAFWLDEGVGRRLNGYLYRLARAGQRLQDLGLPVRFARASWLALAFPATGAATVLAPGRLRTRRQPGSEE